MGIYGLLATVLTIMYSVLSIIAGGVQFTNKAIPKWSKLGMIISGIILLISALLIPNMTNMLYLLVLGLLTLHILAIINGVRMYGKINISHHLIRLLFSFTIMLLYIV